MVHYVETQTKNGQTIRIEVDEAARLGAGFARQSPSPDVSNEVNQDAYNQMLTAIRSCADGVMDTLQDMESLPSTAAVEFAVKVDAEAGAMISKSRETGQFRVSLSWKQPDPDEKE